MNGTVKSPNSQGVVKPSTNVTAYRKARATKGRPKGSQNLARKGRNVTEQRRRIRFKVLTHEDLSEGPPAPPSEITYSDNTNADSTRQSAVQDTSDGLYGSKPHARSRSHINYGNFPVMDDPAKWATPSHAMRPASEPPLRHDGFIQPSQESSHQPFDGNFFNYVGAFSNSFPFFPRCESMPEQQHPAVAPEVFSPPEWDLCWTNPGFQMGWWPIEQSFEGDHAEHHSAYVTPSDARSPSSVPSSSREERQGSAVTDLTSFSEPQSSIPSGLEDIHSGGERFLCGITSAAEGFPHSQMSQPLSMDTFHHALADPQEAATKLERPELAYDDSGNLKAFSMDRFFGQPRDRMSCSAADSAVCQPLQARPLQDTFPL
ncbi:MAG: hypothetical protein Q9162_007585 [Coniocarpon cinnabarinum]